MKADEQCYSCCENKVKTQLEDYQLTVEERNAIELEMEGLLRELQDESAPVMMAELLKLIEKHVGVNDPYYEIKKLYNQKLLQMESRIFSEIETSSNPFETALQYAIVGNYIDFGAMNHVDEEKLRSLLESHGNIELDPREKVLLEKEIQQAKTMVYITDNAGEIVLDKLLIRQMKQMNPKLEVKVILRGSPILNDATLEDADHISLEQYAKLYTNGTYVPGTPMEYISSEARDLICNADFCIAKGQGNFETLCGCGENIYYMFLCKCDLFVKKFNVKQFTPILNNETRIVQSS